MANDPKAGQQHRLCSECQRPEPLWANCLRVDGSCPNKGRKLITHPDRKQPERILTVTHPGYEVVVFFAQDGSGNATAVVRKPNEVDPIILDIPARPGHRIVVERKGEWVEVTYREVT